MASNYIHYAIWHEIVYHPVAYSRRNLTYLWYINLQYLRVVLMRCVHIISWISVIIRLPLWYQIPVTQSNSQNTITEFCPPESEENHKEHYHGNRVVNLFCHGPISKHRSTVYPKKYAHGFCFAVLCCGYTLTDFPISIRLTSLALWQSNDCPSASKASLMNMDKYFMWIHYERLHNHNKAKHNKTVCIFLGIYCNPYGCIRPYHVWTGSHSWVPQHHSLHISITGDRVRVRDAAFLRRFFKPC